MNNILCIECNKYIHAFKYKATLYRCGDANVCSKECSTKRCDKLELIDPYLTSPLSWSHTPNNYIIKTKSMCSFYPHTILEIDDIEDINIDVVKEKYITVKKIFIVIYNFVYNTLSTIILITKKIHII